MSRLVYPEVAASGLPPELVADLGGLTLQGTSLAARATAFAVPDLGVAFDLGRLTSVVAAQPLVLLSHGHLDHISAVLAYLNVRARFHRDRPPTVLCPEPLAVPLRQALAVMPGMESVRKRLDLEEVIRGVRAGEAVEIPVGRVVPFAADHGVPTLGWRIFRWDQERPAVVYASDGSVAPFRETPQLLDAGVAVVECSFVERNRRIAAHLARHAHISDWLEVASALSCDTLVLSHLPPLPRDQIEALVAPLAEAFTGRLVVWAPPL